MENLNIIKFRKKIIKFIEIEEKLKESFYKKQ